MPYPIRDMASFFYPLYSAPCSKGYSGAMSVPFAQKTMPFYAVSDKPALIENKSIIYKLFLNITVVEGIPYH